MLAYITGAPATRTFCIFFTPFQTFVVKAIGYQTKLLSQLDLESKNGEAGGSSDRICKKKSDGILTFF